MSHARERDLSRVGNNHFCALLERLFYTCGGHRVALSHIGADAEKHVRFVHVREGVGHSSAADGGRQTGDRGGVSSTATIINLIRSESRTNKFLHRISRLVRRASGSDAVYCMAAVFLLHFTKTLGGAV